MILTLFLYHVFAFDSHISTLILSFKYGEFVRVQNFSISIASWKEINEMSWIVGRWDFPISTDERVKTLYQGVYN